MKYIRQHIDFRRARTLPYPIMKPQFNIPRQLKPLRDNPRPLGLRPGQPAIDQSYHAPSADLRTMHGELKATAPRLAPSFRDLSRQFLETESTRSYAIEATLFAIIVAISAWPIFTMAQAMGQLR